ncbi:hypothetical protein Tco_1430579 [Tanacetum coccineum]
MAQIKIPRTNDQVGFLRKPDESGFTEIVDFLRSSNLRKAILTLVERVKILEVALKRKTKRILLFDSEEEETEAQGRKFHDLDPLVSLLQELVTPSKTPSKTVNASGEEQVKSAFEEVNTGGIKVSAGIEEINTGSLDVNTGIDLVTICIRVKYLLPTEVEETEAPIDQKEERLKFRKTTRTKFFKISMTLLKLSEDWDTIRAKLQQQMRLQGACAWKGSYVKIMQNGMVELNQRTWKLTQLKKLNFEEVKAEFENLVKQLDTYEGDGGKHGMNEPEDEFEKVLWEYLKNMFEEPLSTDSIWSLPDVYMLIERKYPLSVEVCKVMLDKKLQGGKPDEDCYNLLKMIEKQAGIRK